MFIISAGEGSAPSWGLSPRRQWPAPSLSDRGEGRSPFVALAATACLALWPERLWRRFRCHLPPRQPEEIVGTTRGLTSNSTTFCLSSPLEWGRGRGPYGSSIRPEVIAAAVRPLGAEVVVAAALRASVSHPSAFCCSAGPPTWGVVHTCGGGTRVPFVMAP
jgi:hypothetical protein